MTHYVPVFLTAKAIDSQLQTIPNYHISIVMVMVNHQPLLLLNAIVVDFLGVRASGLLATKALGCRVLRLISRRQSGSSRSNRKF